MDLYLNALKVVKQLGTFEKALVIFQALAWERGRPEVQPAEGKDITAGSKLSHIWRWAYAHHQQAGSLLYAPRQELES